MLKYKFLGLSRYLQELGRLSKVVIQETVNPNGAPQKPEVLAGIEECADVIETAHDPAVFVVDSVLVPKGQKNLEKLAMQPLAQFRETHAAQPQLRCLLPARFTCALSASGPRDRELHCRCSGQSEKHTSFHRSAPPLIFSPKHL